MILVTGATGYIGRNLVHRLMQEQVQFRCLIPEQRLDRITWDTGDPFAPEIITGTILNDEAIFKAVTGVHTIFHLANAFWWGRPRDLERVEISGTRNLVTVARSARVGRIITVSQLGAAASSAFTLLKIKGEVETIIQNSGLAYTVVRSGVVFGEDDAFVNHLSMMLAVTPFVFLLPGIGESTLHPIYIDDLVEALVRCLGRIETVDRIIEIGGIEYTSLRDMMSTIMRVSGRSRMIISLPPYMIRAIIAIYGFFFPRSLMTSQWLDILAGNRTTRIGNTFDYFGFRPQRFEDTLLTYLPGKHTPFSALRAVFRRRPRRI